MEVRDVSEYATALPTLRGLHVAARNRRDDVEAARLKGEMAIVRAAEAVHLHGPLDKEQARRLKRFIDARTAR
jgi:hypothetical protein